MAYQNVGTPRFYVDVLSWLNSIGYMNIIGTGINTSISEITWNGGGLSIQPQGNFSSPVKIPQGMPLNFFATLGHNFKGVHHYPHFHKYLNEEPFWQQCQPRHKNIVNHPGSTTTGFKPDYNGFTITEMVAGGSTNFDPDGNDEDIISLHTYFVDSYALLSEPVITAPHTFKILSVLVGNFYDMSHSPNLSLTLTRDYSGIKTIETRGGASLSNDFGSSPPKWGGLGAWELSESPTGYPPALSKSGRRVWDLSFSYLDSGDVWGSNQSQGSEAYTTTGYDSGDLDANNNFEFNILTDDNFYSQVIHKTNGGQLPFIFQPDKDNNNPDQFAICKFDMKNFKFEQVANGVYNVKLKIREVW